MITRSHPSSGKGFTLVELLITITIIIALASIAFMISKRVMKTANSARDTAIMRSVFNTIPLFASDHNGMLPGPLYSNISAAYKPSARGRLANFIHPYLGYENPTNEEFLPAMAYTWQKSADEKTAPCAYMRKDVPLTPDSEETIRPFGHASSTGEPKSLAAVYSKIDPVRTWAICDIDQLNPAVSKNAGWFPYIPKEMSHGTYRLAIYFDGHSGKMNVDNEPQ